MSSLGIGEPVGSSTAPPRPGERTQVRRVALLRGLVRTARPRQWVKNGLVFAAPFAASAMSDSGVVKRTCATAAAFCIVSSGTYFLNDVADVHRDRLHPTKCRRPIAAGVVPLSLAGIISAVLLLTGLAVALLVSAPTAVVLLIYVAVVVSYSTWLKHVPVIDIVAVAGGFLLRAISGAVAAGVAVSGPFLLLASFGAMFLVVGKREGERMELGDGAAAHRPSLAAYSLPFTAQLLSVSLTATVLSYASWAFNTDAGEPGVPWLALSVLPFVVAMLRATQLVLLGSGADPEELFLRDRGIQAAAAATGILLWLGLYLL